MRVALSLILTAALLPACGPSEIAECAESAMVTGYKDLDGDGFGDPATKTLVCEVGVAQWVSTGTDCDDTRSTVNPQAREECDGRDNDCDQAVDEGLRGLVYYRDADGDGFGDLDDTTEACTPPDGFVENSSDCDDGDALSYPNSEEFCDDKDNDCDGLIDDGDPSINPKSQPVWYLDQDGDTYGDPDTSQLRCDSPGPEWVENDEDCNDRQIGISPDAQELCDGFDNDCDGLIDDTDPTLDRIGINRWYYDFDGDGYGDANVWVEACNQPWFYVGDQTDCDDDNEAIIDAGGTFWLTDADGDGFGDPNATPEGPDCAAPGTGYAPELAGDDCDDTNNAVNPDAPEVCDGVDNDCDTLVDDADDDVDLSGANTWYQDADGDGYGYDDISVEACAAPAGTVADNTDCNDARGDVNPGQPEICNSNVDDDCNGLADESDPGLDPASAPNWYVDFDGDGFGDPNGGVTVACQQPNNQVDNNLDCDDNDPSVLGDVDWIADNDGDGVGAGAPLASGCIRPNPDAVPDLGPQDCDDNDALAYPGADEICGDGIDQDCDGPDQLCPYDTCNQANNGVPVTTDTRYVHDLGTYADNISFADMNPCTGALTDGADAILPVQIGPATHFVAKMGGSADVSLYLLHACPNGGVDAATDCSIGSDAVATGTEQVMYTNATGTTDVLFLVADCNGACTDFTLDLQFNQPGLPDSCADVGNGFAPLTTGGSAIASTLNGLTDDSDLGTVGCTGFDSAGGEAFLPVDLNNGQTLSATYTQTMDDASLYVVSDCTDTLGTCLVGADTNGAGVAESTSYTNSSGTRERVYVAVDCSQPTCRDFRLQVGID